MRRWMPGMFAVLLGADEVMKQYVEDYMEPGEERRIAGGNFSEADPQSRICAWDLRGSAQNRAKCICGCCGSRFCMVAQPDMEEGTLDRKDRKYPCSRRSSRESAGPAAPRKSGRLYWFSDQVFLLFQADCKPGRPVSGGRVASYGSAKNSLI